MPRSSHIAIILCLASLAALGPLATDMYIPAIPEIARSFVTGEGPVQMSITTFFFGMTLGQLFWGPFSDRYGRKTAAIYALAIFALASFGCAVAGDLSTMLVLRFAEGVGGAAGAVLGISVVRDLFSGVEGAKMMGMISLVMGLAPVIAPFSGSVVMQLGHWEAIFVVLGAFSLLSLLLVVLKLPETRKAEDRRTAHPLAVIKVYGEILRKRRFIGYAVTGALLQAGFFAYIGGASSVLMSIYGLTAMSFSLVFAANAVGLGIGVQINSRLITRMSPQTSLRLAIAVNAACGVGLVLMQLTGTATLVTVCVLLFLSVASMGAIMPTGNMLAMEDSRAYAGTAAALVGAMGFGGGAAAGSLVGLLADGTPLPLFAIMAVCSLLGLLTSLTTFPSRDVSAAQLNEPAE